MTDVTKERLRAGVPLADLTLWFEGQGDVTLKVICKLEEVLGVEWVTVS